MNDQPDTDDIPQATAAPRRRWSLPLVWIIPLVAALIGGWVAVKAVLEQGPTITITFKTAEGLEAGQTKLKYKDVNIGVVREIHLGPDLKSVVVTAELDKSARDLLAEDTRFWVVRARIAGGQVSGLGTLLSGSYISVDPGKAKKRSERFVGLENQPIVTSDLPGKQYILRAEELGSLDIGAPVFFRRIQVGSVVAYELDPDGQGVELKIFVHAPYDKYVNANTRFWNASGVDVALNTEGLSVRTEGLSALVIGGIAFQTPLHAALDQTPAPASGAFVLHAKRDIALQKPVTEVVDMLLVFEDSLRGLAPGAPMEFMGVPVGEVTALGLQYNSEHMTFRTLVDVSFYPERLWERVHGERPPREQGAKIMQTLIDRGLRAQLRTGNLLTGQLYVALDYFPDAPKFVLNVGQRPLELPTQHGDLQELQKTVRTIAKRLEKLPLNEIGTELNKTLAQTALLMEQINKDVAPQAHATLESVQQAIDQAERSMLNGQAPLQQGAGEALRELSRAAQSLRALADYLERHPESLIRGKSEDQ